VAPFILIAIIIRLKKGVNKRAKKKSKTCKLPVDINHKESKTASFSGFRIKGSKKSFVILKKATFSKIGDYSECLFIYHINKGFLV
jgi:hypothetical protein